MALPSVFVTDRSTTGASVVSSDDWSLAGTVSSKPAGGVIDAVFVSVPVAVAATVAVSV